MKSRLTRWRLFAAGIAFGAVASTASGQSKLTPNTLTLDESSSSPVAHIHDVAWLAGTWTGTGLGGTVEEVWSEPTEGSMTFMFTLRHEGRPVMHEFGTLTESGGRVLLKLKHFDAELHGWEGRTEYVSFPLVKVTEDAVYFDGLTYRRDGENTLEVFVATNRGDQASEQALSFARPSPQQDNTMDVARDAQGHDRLVEKLTPIIVVDEIEPALKFWQDLGFTLTASVPEGDRLAFALLNVGDIELMYQTRASIEDDQPALASRIGESGSCLFIEVDSLDEIERRLDDLEVVVPKRTMFYGMTELCVRVPGGHFVTFAEKTPEISHDERDE